MPHRNMKSVTELEKSLDMISDQGKHIILCGDFNCPDIDWPSQSLNHNCTDRQVQRRIIDLTAKYNLSQVHETPTRGENLLDLVFTNTPSLLKCSTNTPGISDHDITVSDFITKPQYTIQKERKHFIFRKANWKKSRRTYWNYQQP